ncbi:hypothetical protein PN473_07205 [Dolichospermum circinale CS-545/17]|nr:hypothetical protein [Dolichospermum circinale CS-545/17]
MKEKETILLPSAWDNLNDEDKELAKELTKSILRGERSTQLLLHLLSGENIDDDFKTKAKTISNHEFDFDVITPKKKKEGNRVALVSMTEIEPPDLESNDIVSTLLSAECRRICNNARTEKDKKKCKECQKQFSE